MHTRIDDSLKRHATMLTYKAKKKSILAISSRDLSNHIEALFKRILPGSSIESIDINRGYDLLIKHIDALGEEYVGVIIKKGNVQGSIITASDPIISKLVEAIKQLSSSQLFFKKEKVQVTLNDIWVVFVGELSEGATRKIDFELKRKQPLRLFPLSWLIEQMTEYYPEVFFQGETATFLRDHMQLIDTKHSFANREVSLSESWINPWVREYRSSNNVEQQVHNALELKKIPFTRLEELLKPSNRVLLVGDPGAGKSTAIAKIALDVLTNTLADILEQKPVTQTQIPILLKARDFANYNDSESIIRSVVPKSIAVDNIKVKVLLIDGLDEVTSGNRQNILKKAKDFCDEMDCGLVVTSRKVEYLTDFIFPSFERYEILPLEQQQAMELIGRLVDDQKLIDVLLEGLGREDLKMSLTPLVLELVIKIATLQREIPASAAEIFDQYTDFSLGRFDRARGIEIVFEYYTKKAFLADLSWTEFYQHNRLQVPKRDFNRFVEEYLIEHSFDKTMMNQFIEEIERAGILNVGEVVYFRHRSFLEYFVGYRIVQHVEEYHTLNKELTDAYFSELWSEVVFFYVGIRRRFTEELMTLILNNKEKDLRTKILQLFTGRLLQAGWYTTSKIKKWGISNGIKNTREIHDSLLRIFRESQQSVPDFYAEILALILVEYSYGSKTMTRELVNVVEEFVKSEDPVVLNYGLMLLFAGRKQIDATKRRGIEKIAIKTLSSIDTKQRLSIDGKFQALTLLKFIGKNDTTDELKDIRRKLRAFYRQYPEDIKRLLGPENVPKTYPKNKDLKHM